MDLSIKVEYQQALNGETTAQVVGPHFSRRLHSAYEPGMERDWYAHAAIWGQILIAAGTGLGYHLEFLNTLASPPPLLLCDAFEANLDSTKQKLAHYKGPLLCLHGGQQGAARSLLRSWLRQYPSASIQVLRHPAASLYCQPLVDHVLGLWLQPTPTPSQRLPSVVALPMGNHFLQQELLHGLQELGIQPLLIPEQQMTWEREDSLLRLFQQQRPQACLSVNMKGLDSEGALLRVCQALGIPIHVWFVDDPRPILCAYSQSQWNSFHIWCWERAYVPWLKQHTQAPCQWLSLGADPLLFHPKQVAVDFPLLFTGSSMGPSYLNSIRKRYLHSPSLEQEAFTLSQDLLQGLLQANQILGPRKQNLTPKNAAWFSSLAIHMASQQKRLNWLTPLLPHGLQLAGDPEGWQQVLGASTRALPDIDYRIGLCSHYHRGQVHINLTSCQMPTALNQRSFDIPLCGRLVVQDSQEDLARLFPSKAYVAASSPQEMLEKSKYYLNHPSHTQRIISQAQETILQYHTYAHRLRCIFLEERFTPCF